MKSQGVVGLDSVRRSGRDRDGPPDADVGGIEATRRILHSSPHISVLVLSTLDDDDSIFAALQAGARCYLLKGALMAEILRAIRAVASGEGHFSDRSSPTE